jgi:hypothetical protein
MSNRGMRGITGNAVPTNKVIKSRSYVITNPRPRHAPSKSARSTRVSLRYDVDKYLAWLES